jgi:Ca-activated chloride channel family protein
MSSIARHRRSGRFGWFAVGGVCLALVVGGSAAAYVWYSDDECTGTLTLNVTAAPDQAPVLSQLAAAWTAGNPTVGAGRCARVAVHTMPSFAVAASLGPVWDEQRDGARPDVWAPESSSWLLVAASRAEAAGVLPTGPPPALAYSPVVLAMQRPMAEALGWPTREIGWSDLLGGFSRGQTWARFGHPEWGDLRLAVSDPTRSIAGLAGVLSALDLDNDNVMSDQELLAGVVFSQFVTDLPDTTEPLLRQFKDTAALGRTAQLPAAFPVLERDLAVHAASGPPVSLVPVYLRDAGAVADYPYAVLRTPWVDADRQRVAADFLAYAQGRAGRDAFGEAGFRDTEYAVHNTALLSLDRGFRPRVGPPTRVPTAQSLGQLLGIWAVLLRPNNVLVALDTSGSMNDPVAGATTRLQLLQRAAVEGISLLTNQTVVGLWEFSSKLTPTTDYRELISVGKAGDNVGTVKRRQAMVGAVQGLRATGGTGLYDTIHAAYLSMQRSWIPGASNALVIITDGKNEDDAGLDLAQLLARLRQAVRADRPLPIVAIAVGPAADAQALNQIAAVTGGRTFVARDERTAIQQVVLAFAGRIS